MKFYGFQKMTLLDFPGKVSATVFTGGCNYRCPFCHNAGLVTQINPADAIPEEEILSFLNGRKGLLDGLAITGGEPLMHIGLIPFIRKVRELGFAVKLDTNGAFPETLAEMVDEKLVDYVAVDIKNTPEKYPMTVGIPGFDSKPVWETARFLMQGNVDYEFRTTIVKEFHLIEDIAAISKIIAGSKKYFLQNFVDSGNTIGQNLSSVDRNVLEAMRKIAAENIEQVEIRGI